MNDDLQIDVNDVTESLAMRIAQLEIELAVAKAKIKSMENSVVK